MAVDHRENTPFIHTRYGTSALSQGEYAIHSYTLWNVCIITGRIRHSFIHAMERLHYHRENTPFIHTRYGTSALEQGEYAIHSYTLWNVCIRTGRIRHSFIHAMFHGLWSALEQGEYAIHSYTLWNVCIRTGRIRHSFIHAMERLH